jgi:hypothetical protein
MTDENIAEWAEKRDAKSLGRRGGDNQTCAMHDYMFGKQDDCLRVIKDTIKIEVAKGEHRLELFDMKLEKYITKWALGIIGAVVGFLTMIIISLSAWQFLALRNDVQNFTVSAKQMNEDAVASLHQVDIKLVELGYRQAQIIDFIESLKPEHKALMEFLGRQKKIEEP